MNRVPKQYIEERPSPVQSFPRFTFHIVSYHIAIFFARLIVPSYLSLEPDVSIPESRYYPVGFVPFPMPDWATE